MTQETPASSKATLSLVFGILNFILLPCIGAIVAIVLGKGERSGVGRAGYILGWVGIGLYLVIAAFWVVIALLAGASATINQ